MKKKLYVKRLVAFIGACCLIFSATSMTTHAAFYSNSTTKRQLFAVPEGGWSSVYARVTYQEDYDSSGTNVTLKKRDKSVVYQIGAATTRPTISLLNVKHSSGKVFNSWQRGSLMYGPEWHGGSIYYNTQKVTYVRRDKVTGNLPFLFSCSGGIPASVAGSVSLTFQ